MVGYINTMAQWSKTGLPAQIVEIQLTREMDQTFLMTLCSTQDVFYVDFRLLEMSTLLLVFRVSQRLFGAKTIEFDCDNGVDTTN